MLPPETAVAMEARDRRNLERKSTTKEPTASSSEGGGHDEDLMKRYDKNHEILATKPTAEDEAAQSAGAGEKKKEKRKRVVIDRKHQGLIDSMIVHSTSVPDISDEQLALYSEEHRARYAERKARYEKWMADEQALIDQYLINGYAESVWEVTDDEDDGDETVEKKDSIN